MTYDRLIGPWAILPETLRRIEGAAGQLARGELDTAKLRAQLSAERGRRSAFERAGAVAVIQLAGVLTRHLSFFSVLFGGTSTARVEQDVMAAVNSPDITALLLLLDTPGGSVDGSAELAQTIFSLRGPKPIIALADGMAASAGLWVASAADKFFLRSPTSVTGSVGVISAHFDFSRAEQMRGLKVTEITSSPRKNLESSHMPLSEEARTQIKAEVDFLHGEFVKNLARNRGVSLERASAWGTGETFFGQEAVRLGIADGLRTPGELIAQLAGEIEPTKTLSAKSAKSRMSQIERLRLQAEAFEAGRVAQAVSAVVAQQEAAREQGSKSASTGVITMEKSERKTPEEIDRECAERWRVTPALREEFSSLAAFQAYERARSTGRIGCVVRDVVVKADPRNGGAAPAAV